MSANDDNSQQGRQHQQQQPSKGQADVSHQTGGPGATSPQAGGVTGAAVPLLEGEEVLVDARPAWSAYARQLLLAAVVLVASIAMANEMVIFGFIAALAILAYVAYQRWKVRYVVTDRRMIRLIGISSKSTNEAWMGDVRGLQTGASFIERVLGHGHITVSTDIISGGFGRFRGMTFGGISNWEEVAYIIRQRQNAAKMD